MIERLKCQIPSPRDRHHSRLNVCLLFNRQRHKSFSLSEAFPTSLPAPLIFSQPPPPFCPPPSQTAPWTINFHSLLPNYKHNLQRTKIQFERLPAKIKSFLHRRKSHLNKAYDLLYRFLLLFDTKNFT